MITRVHISCVERVEMKKYKGKKLHFFFNYYCLLQEKVNSGFGG